MYVDGALVWGEEPDGTKPGKNTTPVTTTTTTGPSTTTTTTTTVSGEDGDILYGDANLDKKVSAADAVAILQSIANKDKYELKPQGKINGDVDGESGITGTDALVILKKDAGLVDKLPIK